MNNPTALTQNMINPNIIIKYDNYRNPDVIENTISYIYRLTSAPKKHLPIYCYGIPYFPPNYQDLIKAFHEIRALQANVPARMVWHIILSFYSQPQEIDSTIFYYADSIAKLFGQAYPVCYAYHAKEYHSHFHYIISTASCLEAFPCLDEDRLKIYLGAISALSANHGMRVNFIQKGAVKLV